MLGKDVSYTPANVVMCLDMSVLIYKKRELNSSPFSSESLQLAVCCATKTKQGDSKRFKKKVTEIGSIG